MEGANRRVEGSDGTPKTAFRVHNCFRSRLSGGTLFYCKGYCGRARRRAGCRVERGTSRGSEEFSLLCNDRLNKSAYLAGDPKRKG